MHRPNYIGAPEAYNLNNVCTVINEAFSGFGCYLVGSSITTKNFRDVDVRYIMDDVEFDRIFQGCTLNYSVNALWSLMCASISEWLSNRTGLKIDFQIQRQTDANAQYPDGERQHLGMFVRHERNG